MDTCELCGALIGDAERHKAWHAAIDAIDSTADDALEKAEHAANILYQRGID